jgi:hypothetical protein
VKPANAFQINMADVEHMDEPKKEEIEMPGRRDIPSKRYPTTEEINTLPQTFRAE